MGKFVDPTSRRVMLSELYADVVEDYRINHYASIDDLEDRWVKHCNHSSVTCPLPT